MCASAVGHQTLNGAQNNFCGLEQWKHPVTCFGGLFEGSDISVYDVSSPLINKVEQREMDSSGSGQGPVAGSYKHGNEPSSPVAERVLASQGLYSMELVC